MFQRPNERPTSFEVEASTVFAEKNEKKKMKTVRCNLETKRVEM